MKIVGFKLKHSFSDIVGKIEDDLYEKIKKREVEVFTIKEPYLISWRQVMDKENGPVPMPQLQHLNNFADDPLKSEDITISFNDILYSFQSDSLEEFYREVLTGIKTASNKVISLS